MQYVRPIGFDSAEITGDTGYKGEILDGGETRTLIATVVPAGVPHHNWRSGGQEGRR